MRPGEALRRAGRALGPSAGGEADGDTLTLRVPPGDWAAALRFARDEAGCDFFDWLSAIDEEDRGLTVVAHLYSLGARTHLFLRTLVPPGQTRLPTATAVYRGAAWHERETHEMFGLVFEGHPGLAPLLLPEGFEGRPLRKDFPLAARAAPEWPGAREPGESAASPSRRRRRPPPGAPEGWRAP